ncbi:MAG: glycosyltransferase family 4 protein [Rhodocyclaceae bacterium]|jgi:UDP-GlcNAc:undecaprenyl-phosphate GlcNAc-1-phosphate transferase|nr:glycosyltransferase family 4 protein [Rhodocyclaceae bacterium]MCA3133306.1 glycosyltransferase family 4 protein [Rhodocyclaceae bacterium]MCA3142217.1 glycosyltransferase family 4 protein [Rhodocyclaceae bacterium]MCA3146494.1 glycosyltransferase family 4 protein [Rhodocyclaceae bacterium]
MAPSALLAPLTAFLLSHLALRVLLSARGRGLLLDQPNERSLHTRPVPRSGGIAIVTGVLAAAVWVRSPLPLVGGVAALLTLSLLDDWRSLPSGLRLVVHLGVCGAFCTSALSHLPWPWWILLALALGWMTNLYNFMDGSDGLAGGMAVVGFGACAIAASLGGDSALGWWCASVAASSLAFLLVNFPPARIFMGDSGSVPLGFLAGAVGLLGWRDGQWPWWFPLAVFAPFVADASITLLRRALRRERLWQAHRDHYYQRLILLGWSHHRTAIAEYALMAACAAGALLALGRPPEVQAMLLAPPAVLLLGGMVAVDRAWAQRRPCAQPERAA